MDVEEFVEVEMAGHGSWSSVRAENDGRDCFESMSRARELRGRHRLKADGAGGGNSAVKRPL